MLDNMREMWCTWIKQVMFAAVLFSSTKLQGKVTGTQVWQAKSIKNVTCWPTRMRTKNTCTMADSDGNSDGNHSGPSGSDGNHSGTSGSCHLIPPSNLRISLEQTRQRFLTSLQRLQSNLLQTISFNNKLSRRFPRSVFPSIIYSMHGDCFILGSQNATTKGPNIELPAFQGVFHTFEDLTWLEIWIRYIYI